MIKKKKQNKELEVSELNSCSKLISIDGCPPAKYFKITLLPLTKGWLGNKTGYRIDSVSRHYAHEHKYSKSGVTINRGVISTMLNSVFRFFPDLIPLWTIQIKGMPKLYVMTEQHFEYLRNKASLYETGWEKS